MLYVRAPSCEEISNVGNYPNVIVYVYANLYRTVKNYTKPYVNGLILCAIVMASITCIDIK